MDEVSPEDEGMGQSRSVSWSPSPTIMADGKDVIVAPSTADKTTHSRWTKLWFLGGKY